MKRVHLYIGFVIILLSACSTQEKKGQSVQSEKPEVNHEEGSYSDGAEYEHYMFFNNLKTIQRNIEDLLQLDPHEVNEILSNGHAWADDHIATSSDDIEEVKNFLVNELSGGNTDLIQEEPAQ